MANILKIGNRVLKIGGRILRGDSGSAPVDPYNPLGLPPFTIRCKFSSGYTPTQGNSRTLVDAGENIWDITKNSTNWNDLFSYVSIIEVLGANTTGVTSMCRMFSVTELTTVPLFDTSSCTDMSFMFDNISSLTTVPLFDTSSCTNMSYMLRSCMALTTVPLFDTSSCTDMSNMFEDCGNVLSGALALYQQASTQANPPTQHDYCFYNCGAWTESGIEELNQIPSSWGGTGA